MKICLKEISSFLIVYILFESFIAKGQPYYFRHYEVESGLSNNTVYCSIQDKNGFMWFGTKHGLNRFDGYRFKIFSIINSVQINLDRDHISSLAVDDNNVLWVGTQKGLFCMNTHTETISPFTDSLKNINDLFFDRSNNLWFTAETSLYHYDFRTKKLENISAIQKFSISSICETDDGNMWFSTIDGFIWKLDVNTKEFSSFSLFMHSPPAPTNWILKIHATGNGLIYVGTTNQGLKEFNTVTGHYKDVLTNNPDKTEIYIRDILKTDEDELWIGSESGIYILNTKTKETTQLKKRQLDSYSLSDNAVYSLFKDNEGGIWAGTYFGGINYYSKRYSFFKKYFPGASVSPISGNVVREICEDKFGNVWIGTEDAGLNKLDAETGVVKSFQPTGVNGSITYPNIHGLLAVDNNLWIGTFENGIDIMDIKTGIVKKHYSSRTPKSGLRNNFIVNLLQTKKGEIYIATGNGLFQFIKEEDKFIKPYTDLAYGFISSLIEDHNGNIWVSTHTRGLYFLDLEKKQSIRYSHTHDSNSISNNTVNAILEDSYQQIWIATEGGGLCKLQPKNGSITRYTVANGLPSNFIFKILEDEQKTLWISTSKGLVQFHPQNGVVNIYTKSNGLLNDQFNYNSGFKDKSGMLYFGSVRGMVTFNPQKLSDTKFLPPIYFTGFQVNNKELEIHAGKNKLAQSILFTEKLTLPFNHASFSIDFSALSFASPEQTEYSYKMEGVDKEWNYIKSNRKVYFTSLKPGTYIFKVKAKSAAFQGTQEKQLTISISPPFFATKLAYFLYAVAIILLIYYLLKIYHNNQENKKRKEIYEAKIDFFTNLAHEIKTPLTLIKGPVENLNEIVNDTPGIKADVIRLERNTNRLINLVNQILDFRQTEIKGFSLDFANINLSELLRETYITFEQPANKRNLHYTIELPSSDVFIMADAEALVKILSNLFSNAVKYADRKISIQLTAPQCDDAFVYVQIKNDGYLIPENMKKKIFEPFFRLKERSKQIGTGIGLALAFSLTELHRGKLCLNNVDDGMNTFEIALPYANKNINHG